MGEILDRHGLVRTLGGVDGYLAFFARDRSLDRAVVEQAILDGAARVSPAARGCMYVVPSSGAALWLRLADLLSRDRDAKDRQRAGIRAADMRKTSKAVLEALAEHGPLSTDGLRKVLPATAVRSLGEQGKKAGVSSTLPPALRILEFAREIERVPEEGRIDRERYLWRLPEDAGSPDAPNAPDGRQPETTDSLPELLSEIAALYLRAAGLSTVRAFAGWCGVSQRDAKGALVGVGAEVVEVEGEDEPYFLDRHSSAAAEAAKAEDSPAVALLPFEDNLLALHGGPRLLTEPAHLSLEVPSWGRPNRLTLAKAKHLSYRSFVADGALAGFWERDPDDGELIVAPFRRPGAKTRRAIEEAVAATGAFLESFGHARSFSLDTDEELAKRAAALRRMATRL